MREVKVIGMVLLVVYWFVYGIVAVSGGLPEYASDLFLASVVATFCACIALEMIY